MNKKGTEFINWYADELAISGGFNNHNESLQYAINYLDWFKSIYWKLIIININNKSFRLSKEELE